MVKYLKKMINTFENSTNFESKIKDFKLMMSDLILEYQSKREEKIYKVKYNYYSY